MRSSKRLRTDIASGEMEQQDDSLNIVNYMVGGAGELDGSGQESILEEIAQSLEISSGNTGQTQGEMCQICNITTVDTKRHSELHARFGDGPVSLFKCEICGREYGKKAHLARHMTLHSDKRPFQCVVCSKAFRSKRNLDDHTRIHTGEKPFKCEHCGKCFTGNSAYRTHLRTHTGEKPHGCEICQKRFVSSTLLKQHKQKHGDSVTCPVCGKVFDTLRYMTSHLQRVHSSPGVSFLQTEDGVFLCEKCNKICRDQDEIQKHIESHRYEACKFCNRAVLTESMPQHWLRMHPEEKETEDIVPKKVYDCEFCGKKYYARTSFDYHIGKARGKTGVEGMFCKVCGLEFPCRTQANEHRSTHDPYEEEQYVYNAETGSVEINTGCAPEQEARPRRKSSRTPKNSVKIILPSKQVFTLMMTKPRNQNDIRVFKIPTLNNEEQNSKSGDFQIVTQNNSAPIVKTENNGKVVEKLNGNTDDETFYSSLPKVVFPDDATPCPCPICGKQFISKVCLDNHIEKSHFDPFVKFVQTQDGSYFCLKCKILFKTLEELEGHIETHRFVTCKICSKEILDDMAADHMFRKHPENVRMLDVHPKTKFPCENCGKVYYAVSKWVAHVGISDSSSLVCTVCGEQLLCKRELKKHMYSHVDIADKDHSF